MPNKKYFSYIRVSTHKQGEYGTSLAEQQSAIQRYSRAWNLRIVRCYEELETAAKQGRPVFLDMIKALKRGEADGLIVHKIDRSARNLKDWGAIGDLIDEGFEVHFANESLDLNSRGGRLSADIQAVVAADYIRNLREEVKKGFYGRLKQGLYPMPAPIGYVDAGKGEPKSIDPVHGPLIRKAFELYSTGKFGLYALSDKMFDLGLRNKKSNKVSIGGLSTILHSLFYIGLIKIEKTGEVFVGRHKPLVSKALFDKAQGVLKGKNVRKTERHFFTFRRHINCSKCGNFFVPEKQKGMTYYRCHTRGCTRGGIREDLIDDELLQAFGKIRMNDSEYHFIRKVAQSDGENWRAEQKIKVKQTNLQLEQLRDRLSKLSDAYIDGVFDKETYIEKKNTILLEEKSVSEKLSKLDRDKGEATKRLEAFLELVNSVYLSYKSGSPEERRDLVRMISSNFSVNGKSVLINLEYPFNLMVERPPFFSGAPHREAVRTFAKKLLQYFTDLDTSKGDDKFLEFVTSKQGNIVGNNFPARHN